MTNAPQIPGPARRCPVCEQTMRQTVCPTDRMATLLVDLPVHDAPAPAISEVLAGRYEVRERIGQGGFGQVYRARHLGTGQDIALKLLRVPAEDDATFAVQRFFLEARATSGLTHPNTVRVFDFGQDDLGRVFLAMELLKGRTLREELTVRVGRGARFTDAEVADIGVAITRSLGEAHERGLVHRDLKPDNIFLHQVAGDDPVVKVLDFGIAKLGTGQRHTLSSDTSVPGTPAYMAPEHAFNQPVDGRTDLYALGVVLYQLVTLQLPYRAPSDPQILYMHAYEAVPDPRDVSPCGDGLAQVIRQAMTKRPEDRFADARHMRAALSEALGGSAVSGDAVTPVGTAPPPSHRVPRAAAPDPVGPRRGRAPLALAGLAAAGLLVGLGGWWWSRAQVVAAPVSAQAVAVEPERAAAPSNPALTGVGATAMEPAPAAAGASEAAAAIPGAVPPVVSAPGAAQPEASASAPGAAQPEASASAPGAAQPEGGAASPTGAVQPGAAPAAVVEPNAVAAPPKASAARRTKRRRRARKPASPPTEVAPKKKDVLHMRLEELVEQP